MATLEARHSKQTLENGIHTAVAYEFADSAERTGVTGLTSEDQYKLAIQLDTEELYILINPVGPVWGIVSNVSSGAVVDINVAKSTAGTITAGSIVYAAGYDVPNSRILVEAAQANSTSTMPAIGVVIEDVDNSTGGALRIAGTLNGVIDTSGDSFGDTAYVSPSVAGDYVTTPPTGTNLVQSIFNILTVANPGAVFIDKANIRWLSSTTPEELTDSSGSVGTGNTAARADHVHAHGDRGGGTLHADATTSVSGFMSGTDKTAHDKWVNALEAVDEPSGFPNRTDSQYSFTDGTRTFQISPVSGSYSFFVKGVEFTKSGTDSVVWPDSEGAHYHYFDDTGTLQTTQDVAVLEEVVLREGAFVAYNYWNAADNESIFVAEERHGFMPGDTHLHFHQAFGAQWVSGGEIGNITADASGDNDIHAQFSVGNVRMNDEDLRFDFTDGNPQDLAPAIQMPIYYRFGANGDWKVKPADGFPLIYSDGSTFTGGNGRAAYNQFTGATWQLTEVGQEDFVLIHVWVTNEINTPVIGICGQNQYTTLQEARAGADAEIGQLLGVQALFAVEAAPLGTVIFQTSTGYTNSPAARIRTTASGDEYIDFRGRNADTTVTPHADRHVKNGTDPIDGDIIEISWVPSNYTRTTSPSEVSNLDELTAHLAGIDAELSTFGTGDVVGPASATDNAITRFNGTSGKLIQNSSTTISDSGNMSLVGTISLGNNAISTGTIQLPSTGTIYGDSSGTAKKLFEYDGSGNTLAIGDGAGGDSVTGITLDAATSIDIDIAGSTQIAVTSSAITLGIDLALGSNDISGVTNLNSKVADNLVVGPGSATDNALVRFDTAAGDIVQNSNATLDDSGNLSLGGSIDLNSNNITEMNNATFAAEFDNGNSGTTPTIDWTDGQKQTITINGSATISFTDPPGPCNLLLRIVHDATATSYTLTWPGSVNWSAQTQPELTNTASSIDIFTFYYSGSAYYGVASLDFG